MRRIPASFIRAPEPTRSKRTRRCLRWGTRRRATWGLYAIAVVALLGVASPAVSAAAAQAPASITNATTGLSDAASIAPVAACGPANSVRATCLAQILGVRGTSALVHPRLRQPSSIYRFARARPRRSHATSAVIPAAAAPQPGTPAYLQQAYDLAYLAGNAGSSATIAIVDAFDDPNAESDLAVYRAEFGLPACGNGCFAKYDQNGGTSYPTGSGYPETDIAGWQLEISLDLDAVSALCPYCHIDLIEAHSDGVPDLAQAQLTAGTLPGVNVISDSWDMPLSGSPARNFPKTGDYTFRGITTVAASGDSGYPGYSASGDPISDFPAALPGVTAAGGTTLEPASASGVQSVRGFTESAWSGAGSGCNLWASQPAYQAGINSGCTGRAYSDISADADPATGMQVYDSNPPYGGWVVAGGTSEASPLIASYYALVGSAATAQGPSWAYANAALLNDPTSGSNGSCLASISAICNAGPGYDGPTGVGSISGAVVSGAPGIAGPGTNGSYSLAVTANSAQLQGGVYPNGADTTYWWEYGTTTAYGQQTPGTPANDIGSGTAPAPVTDSLSGLSPGQTYHYRLVAQNSFGTEYGYDYTFTVPASTAGSPGQGSNPNPPTTTTSSPPSTTTTSSPPVTGTGASGSTGTSPVSAPGLTSIRVGAAATSATVSATVATGGVATTSRLQYGTTRSLGNTTSGSQSSGATANAQWTLRNLSPGKVYYFRVVASNAGGSSAGAVVRFRTSPVTITRIATSGSVLDVVLRCHGSAACHVLLQGRSGARVMLASQTTIRGNRTSTVTLRLSKSFRTLATVRRNATLLVLSTWNGLTATVSATV